MSDRNKRLLLYAAKCVSGTGLIFFLAGWWHYNDTSWCLISLLLVLSPDQKEAIPLAMNRIKANFVGAGIGMLALVLPQFGVLNICMALAVAVFVCDALKLVVATRSALAAVVIIMLHGEGRHLWDTALERLVAVVTGCLLALLITYLFHFNLRPGREPLESPGQEG